MSKLITNEALRMLGDFANGIRIEFYVTPEGNEDGMLVQGELSKRFDIRTFNRLKNLGLIYSSRFREFGVLWLQYRISTKGWEVFNART